MIVPDDIERYAAEHTTPHDALLAELAEETRATLECPEMLTGPVEGRLLELLVFAIGAKRVLQIGTYSGYSAISMAMLIGMWPDSTARSNRCSPFSSSRMTPRTYSKLRPIFWAISSGLCCPPGRYQDAATHTVSRTNR